jgi:hypothetical protein
VGEPQGQEQAVVGERRTQGFLCCGCHGGTRCQIALVCDNLGKKEDIVRLKNKSHL